MAPRKHQRQRVQVQRTYVFETEALSEDDAKIAAEYAEKHRKLNGKRRLGEALTILEAVSTLQILRADLQGRLDGVLSDVRTILAESK